MYLRLYTTTLHTLLPRHSARSNAALASLESWMQDHAHEGAAQAAEASSLAQAVKKMANLRHGLD